MVKEVKKSKFTELYSSENKDVTELVELYKKNKYYARILFMNSNKEAFYTFRAVEFSEDNGDFSIIIERKLFGISKSNRMYSNQKKLMSIVKKKDKFYFIDNRHTRKIRLLMVSDIIKYGTVNTVNSGELQNIILDRLKEKLTWLRTPLEYSDLMVKYSLYYIYSNKLFSKKKILTNVFGFNYPISNKMYEKINENENKNLNSLFNLKYYHEYMINHDNFNVSWMERTNLNMFYDTLKMGKTLDKKVNLSWSLKRLESEHDKWGSLITDVIMIQNNKPLNISKIYLDFAEFNNVEILKTTKDLAIEGKQKGHCVATYANRINSGNSAIYRVDGYTLELGFNYGTNVKVRVSQLRGRFNSEAPKKVSDKVDKLVKAFNVRNEKKNVVYDMKFSTDHYFMGIEEELPF